MFEFTDVTVAYDGRLALRLSATRFEAGTLVALIGPNGSGKTTLLRLLAGLEKPTAGTLTRSETERSGVAYVGQRHDQHRWMPLTAGEVLKMGRYGARGLVGRLDSADRASISDAAARLGVEDLLSRPFGTLSGGQQQRVLIAKALVQDASCLLLDEPITGLDFTSQEIILEVVGSERDRGRLVMLSTHHLDEAERCDRVLLLATSVIADGPPGQVLRAGPLSEAFGHRVLEDPDGNGAIVIDDHGHNHAHDPAAISLTSSSDFTP
ncbi:MAG: metal ABC transporter ATP-binding protein [Acidimicrobiales bacterium]